MTYTFEFSWLAVCYPQTLSGIAITIELIAVAAFVGITVGISCACALGPSLAEAACDRLCGAHSQHTFLI